MLIVEHPSLHIPEHQYIFHVLINEFLGLHYESRPRDRSDIRITLANDSQQKELVIDDEFLRMPSERWMTPASLPQVPVPHANLSALLPSNKAWSHDVPILFGPPDRSNWFNLSDTHVVLRMDIIGGAFFQLTRYEECVTTTRDNHDWFPAYASLAYKEGFLRRPLVNEYLEVLWSAIHHLWPGLQRRPRHYQTHMSHDVDWPAATYGLPLSRVAISAAGDILTRKDPLLAGRRLASAYHSRRGRPDRDIANTFNDIMTLSEKHGLTSAFYFITDHSGGSIDGTYSLDLPWIRSLLLKIHQRGHELGIHPSYNTYRDVDQTSKEFHRLLDTCANLGIKQSQWGGRQHYLRWTSPDTWQNWEDAGITYDSTLSFADEVGFRAGTCYEYPVFNLLTRKQLHLRERPLIVMEGTLFGQVSPAYMSLSTDDSFSTVQSLATACKHHHGDFTMLWHNNQLMTPSLMQTYSSALELILSPS